MSSLLRVVVWSAAALFAVPAIAARDPVVRAPAGAVSGEVSGRVNVFRGLPYALPPVGAARWKAPVAMPTWNGTRDATKFGAACFQPKRTTASQACRDGDSPAGSAHHPRSLRIRCPG